MSDRQNNGDRGHRSVSCRDKALAPGVPTEGPRRDNITAPTPVEATLVREGAPPSTRAELEWLRLLLDAFPEYVMLINQDHRILMVNEAVRRDLGQAATSLVGGYCPQVVHCRSTPFPGCPLSRAVSEGELAEAELHDADRQQWLRSLICPTAFRDENGRKVFLHFADDITARKRLEAQRSELLEEVITARDAERRHIAREIHDDPLQALAAIGVRLQSIETSDDVASLRSQLGELRRFVAQTADNLRRLASGLHPRVLDDLGLAAAIERHVQEYSTASGIRVVLHISGLSRDRKLPRPLEISIFRITQEALANIARHSGATLASIEMSHRRNELQLIVEDNGCGFDPGWLDEQSANDDGTRRLGLAAIRERVALLSGSMKLERRPEGGTSVYVRVPVSEPAG